MKMTRCRWVANGRITNIVEYPGAIPSAGDNGETIVADGPEGVGDAFDVTATQKTSLLASMDQIIIQELFRLTNETRILQLKGQLTFPQYLALLKGMMS